MVPLIVPSFSLDPTPSNSAACLPPPQPSSSSSSPLPQTWCLASATSGHPPHVLAGCQGPSPLLLPGSPAPGTVGLSPAVYSHTPTCTSMLPSCSLGSMPQPPSDPRGSCCSVLAQPSVETFSLPTVFSLVVLTTTHVCALEVYILGRDPFPELQASVLKQLPAVPHGGSTDAPNSACLKPCLMHLAIPSQSLLLDLQVM